MTRTEEERENHTWWDYKLGRKLNRLFNLIYAIRFRIVQEPLKMEDKNWWVFFEKHLLARLTQARLTDLHGLALREVSKGVFDGVHRIGLLRRFSY